MILYGMFRMKNKPENLYWLCYQGCSMFDPKKMVCLSPFSHYKPLGRMRRKNTNSYPSKKRETWIPTSEKIIHVNRNFEYAKKKYGCVMHLRVIVITVGCFRTSLAIPYIQSLVHNTVNFVINGMDFFFGKRKID